MDLVDKYANNVKLNDGMCTLYVCSHIGGLLRSKLGDSDTTVFWIGRVPLRESVASPENEGHF